MAATLRGRRSPVFRTHHFLLPLLFALGCATEGGDKGVPASQPEWDTGDYLDDDDSWEPMDDGEVSATDESWDTEAGAYGGLRPTNPEVLVDPESDHYAPDGILHVEFDLENTGELDFGQEPGLILTVDHPDIQLAEPTQWVDALASGERVRLQWWAAVGPMVSAGETLAFTAEVTARNCGENCPVPHTASVRITLD